MERAGFEPAASGLQTHAIVRPHLTPTDRIGMTEPEISRPSERSLTPFDGGPLAPRSRGRCLNGQRFGAQGLSVGPTEGLLPTPSEFAPQRAASTLLAAQPG